MRPRRIELHLHRAPHVPSCQPPPFEDRTNTSLNLGSGWGPGFFLIGVKESFRFEHGMSYWNQRETTLPRKDQGPFTVAMLVLRLMMYSRHLNSKLHSSNTI